MLFTSLFFLWSFKNEQKIIGKWELIPNASCSNPIDYQNFIEFLPKGGYQSILEYNKGGKKSILSYYGTWKYKNQLIINQIKSPMINDLIKKYDYSETTYNIAPIVDKNNLTLMMFTGRDYNHKTKKFTSSRSFSATCIYKRVIK